MIQGKTREDRHHVTSEVSNPVRSSGGNLLDFKQFSNLAVCFTIELPPSGIAFLNEEPDRLCDEQRVAFCLGIDRFDKAVGWIDTCRDLYEPRNVTSANAPQDYPLEQPFPAQVAESHRQRVATVQLDIPVRAHNEDLAGCQFPRHELQERQSGLVCPVQIVQHEDKRPNVRRRFEES